MLYNILLVLLNVASSATESVAEDSSFGGYLLLMILLFVVTIALGIARACEKMKRLRSLKNEDSCSLFSE